MLAERKSANMKNIMQDKKECFITGATKGLHKHHIFGAYNRDNSEKYGLWVWLRWDRHIENSPHSTPHNDKDVDAYLKKLGQKKFEETHSRDEFVRIFGRNYL